MNHVTACRVISKIPMRYAAWLTSALILLRLLGWLIELVGYTGFWQQAVGVKGELKHFKATKVVYPLIPRNLGFFLELWDYHTLYSDLFSLPIWLCWLANWLTTALVGKDSLAFNRSSKYLHPQSCTDQRRIMKLKLTKIKEPDKQLEVWAKMNPACANGDVAINSDEHHLNIVWEFLYLCYPPSQSVIVMAYS